MSDAATARPLVQAAGIDRRAWTRRRALGGLLGSSALVLIFGFAFGLSLSTPAFLGAVLGCFGVILSFLSLLAASMRRPPELSPRGLAIDQGAVHLLDGEARERSIPLARIAQGWWEEPDRVHLALKNGQVLVLRVADTAAGEQLLRALGLNAAERVLRMPLASAASRIPGGSIFGGGLLALLGGGLLFATMMLAYSARSMLEHVDVTQIGVFSVIAAMSALLSFALYAISGALRRREAVIGTDGIAYQKSVRTEFIPYAQIAEVLPDTRGVRLVLKSGRRVVLPTRGFGGRPLPLAPQSTPPKSPEEAQRRVLLDRIREAMAAGGGDELAQVALDRLDRNGRSLGAWREELRRLLTAEGDYRTARISPEELGGVIVDPAAPAERRIAAAVALSARESGEARRRVRIAVQACADEDLQRALESAAEGEIDEQTLERAAVRRLEVRR